MPAIPLAILTVLVAAGLGALVGAEREWRRHPGGLRSCALVSAAAAVFARMAVAHGGASPGATLGAIITGFGLGLIEGLTKVFYPEASNVVIFVIMTIVLLIKPAGLFGTQK